MKKFFVLSSWRTALGNLLPSAHGHQGGSRIAAIGSMLIMAFAVIGCDDSSSAHGLHHSCISAAYMLSGELRAAAIFNPYVGELFTAVKGEGAFLNGRPLRVSDGALAESLVCCGTTPYDAALADRGFALMKAAFLAGLDIRREGSAALDLCSAAAGRCGVYFELGLSLWDYAAGKLLVEEAGGVCCTIDGAALPMDPTRPSVVAGGRRAVEEFLQLAREV